MRPATIAPSQPHGAVNPDGLLPKVPGDLGHARGLRHSERAPAVAMAARHAIAGVLRKVAIMLHCQGIARTRQVVILVDEPNLAGTHSQLTRYRI